MVFISKYFRILNSDRKMRELNLRQVDRQPKAPCGGKHSFIHFCFFLSQGKISFFYTLYWYCNNVYHLKSGLSLSQELMITHILLMNMLFRLYVNDYNYNKSCLGACFSTTEYLPQRLVAWNTFLLVYLVP